MALEYLSSGTAVTDEVIACTESVSLGGSSLYLGRVAGLASHSVIGNTSADYGVWTAASKGGYRVDVLASGVPGSTAEVLWDLQSGRVYSTTSRSVYGRYWKYADLMNEGRVYGPINIPFSLTGTAEDVYVDRCPWKVKWGYYAISVDGNRPSSATLSLGLYGATGAAGASASLTLGATAGQVTAWTALSFSQTTSDLIVIRNKAGNAPFSNIKITLREKLE